MVRTQPSPASSTARGPSRPPPIAPTGPAAWRPNINKIAQPWRRGGLRPSGIASRLRSSQAPSSSLASIPEGKTPSIKELTADMNKLIVANSAQARSVRPGPAVVPARYMTSVTQQDSNQQRSQSGNQNSSPSSNQNNIGFLIPSKAPTAATATTIQARHNRRGYGYHNKSTNNSISSRASNPPLLQQNPMITRLFARTSADYAQGQIVWFPYVVANQDPTVDPNDPHFTVILVGPIYCKFRMGIILYVFAETLQIAPIFSWTNRSIGSRKPYLLAEYMQIVDQGVDLRFFQPEGNYAPLVSMTRTPLLPTSTLHVTGGVTLKSNEDIRPIGNLTAESTGDMIAAFDRLCGRSN